MQQRAREQRGSIGHTQIARRRLERCLTLPHPARVDPRPRLRAAQNLVLVRRAVRVSRVAPLRPRW